MSKNIETIIGTTQNRKNGIVISGDKDYFVKNISYWKEEYVDKKVKATGIITQTTNNAVLPPSDDGIIRQGIQTTSWEQYHAYSKQYWIEVEKIEVLE